jgi:hypothetical protein
MTAQALVEPDAFDHVRNRAGKIVDGRVRSERQVEVVQCMLQHLLQPLQPPHVLVHAGPVDTYASFDSDWVPEEYLADYYHEVKPDELQTIAFFVAAMKQVEPGEPILLFGVGPTLHHVFLAAGKASEIQLADYLWTNLDEIEKWIRRDAHAHDWRAFVRDTLQCEGITSPTDEQVWQREELTRGKITKLLQVDARHADPLRERTGTARGHVHHRRPAPLPPVSGRGEAVPERERRRGRPQAVLEPEFDCGAGSIQVRELAGHQSQGYSGIVLGWARRRAYACPVPGNPTGQLTPVLWSGQ